MDELLEEICLREDMLLEMARVGFIGDEYEVFIHTNDPGHIPHFHMWDKATRGQNFHTCIRIDKPEYFHHTGKEDKLNSNTKKALINFLKSSPLKFGYFDTNWNIVIYMWNMNNSEVEIPKDMPMPDYRLL